MIRDLPADTSKQLLLKRRCVKQGRLEKMTEAVRKPATILKQYKREEPGRQPTALYPDYRATIRRSPRKPLIMLPHTLSEITGPVFGHESVSEGDKDLTRQHAGEPLGERIIVSGRVLDDHGRPVPHTLIEIWQANASGRYRHDRDNH